MYFDQIHSISYSSNSFSTPSSLFPLNFMCSLFVKHSFNTHCILLMLPICAWAQDHLLEHGHPLRPASLKKLTLSASAVTVAIAPQIGEGPNQSLPGPCWDFCWLIFAIISSCVQMHWCDRKVHFHSRHSLLLALKLSLPLFCNEGGGDTGVSFRDRHPF